MKDDSNFRIVLNEPKYILPQGNGFDLPTIFGVCFDFPNENLEMFWGDIKIPFTYDYMVAQIIREAMEMLDAVCNDSSGEYSFTIGMNGLHAEWKLMWNMNELDLTSSWITAPQLLKDKLNSQNHLKVKTSEFLREWLKLLNFLIAIIQAAKIEIEDSYYSFEFLMKVKLNSENRMNELS